MVLRLDRYRLDDNARFVFVAGEHDQERSVDEPDPLRLIEPTPGCHLERLTGHDHCVFHRDQAADLGTRYLDAIAYPASTGPAAMVGGQGEAYDCGTSAFSGLPALVVPGSLTPEGLPLGLELLGRPLGDADLIAIAAGYAAQLGPRPLPLTTPALATP